MIFILPAFISACAPCRVAGAAETAVLKLIAPQMSGTMGASAAPLDAVLDGFLQVLGQEAGLKIEAKRIDAPKNGFEALEKALLDAFRKDGDLIWLTPLQLVGAERSGVSVEILALPAFEKGAKLKTCAFHALKGDAGVKDFKGKRVVAPYDWMAVSDAMRAEKIGGAPADYFGEPAWTDNLLSAPFLIVKGQADVMWAPEVLFEGLAMTNKKIAELKKSACHEVFVSVPVLAAKPALPAKTKKALTGALTRLHEKPKFVALSPYIYKLKLRFLAADDLLAKEWLKAAGSETSGDREKKYRGWEKKTFEEARKRAAKK